MTEKDLEKLIVDTAKKYANDNWEYVLTYGEEKINNYADLKQAFRDGFEAGMKFKEEELS